jgi:hypothetical protein
MNGLDAPVMLVCHIRNQKGACCSSSVNLVAIGGLGPWAGRGKFIWLPGLVCVDLKSVKIHRGSQEVLF